MKLEWKQITAAFVIGVFLGGIVAYRLAPSPFHRGGQRFHQRLMERFNSELKLTPDQRVQVERILSDCRKELDKLREQAHPQFQNIKKSTEQKIRMLLSKEQQLRFDRLTAEMDARRAKRRLEKKF